MSPSQNDIDPRVLGQLLAAQSVSSVLSSRQKMGEFVCRAVEGVPGVASCAACLPGAERPRLGGESAPECADCDVPKGDVDHAPSHPCRLSSRAGIQIFPLKTQDRHFGVLLLKLEERERYAPYEPFISNLANGLAVNIDRQWQKERLEAANVELRRHREHLEEVVRERTAQLEEDIAGRKRAEGALQTETANLDAIFESSPIGMLILDETTNIVRANAAILVLCGGNKSDVLQHRPGNALRCVHSTKDPRGCGYAPDCPLCPARNGIEGLIASGGTMHGAELELDLIRDGVPRKVWMCSGAEPVMMNGRRHLCVAMEEITARKQAEATVRQKVEELRASNDELEQFNRAMVGRELRMIELKEEINELCRRLGEPPRHASQESD